MAESIPREKNQATGIVLSRYVVDGSCKDITDVKGAGLPYLSKKETRMAAVYGIFLTNSRLILHCQRCRQNQVGLACTIWNVAMLECTGNSFKMIGIEN